MIFQWGLTYRFFLALPLTNTLVPICLPTAYLWLVDTLALRRGTWVIESGTKVNIQLWNSLEAEEALFFLVTNVMVVFGLVAIDNAAAVYQYMVATSDAVKDPSILQLIVLFLTHRREYDRNFISGLSQAVYDLQSKSQSMYLGSMLFDSPLQIDLIFLYSFCRKMDDLVDEAIDRDTARYWIQQCSKSLAVIFNHIKVDADGNKGLERLIPPTLFLPICLLPASRLSSQPLYNLLKGFEMDLEFDSKAGTFPIATENDLELYAFRVASTVAASVLNLIFYHHQEDIKNDDYVRLIAAAERMGQALQYVNIARDIVQDAQYQRVYFPTSWLNEEGLTPSMVVENPTHPRLAVLRDRLLDKAETCAKDSQEAIDELPSKIRGPLRVTILSYMEIGKALRELQVSACDSKLKLPWWRLFKVAWAATY
ncbi:terpene cyclase [Aspergillus tanneri]|uniref:Bifunctional lycopene cyclase/phytoene synthase n=2 Tax=Aspergillus tanneri TaxID=1220188 RepID=A0A5M9MHD8_9EURO|nr:terpene cyclase [Aspergillus tanneri]KAA8644423.1 terpene cyclase [Aspergillus tanneri]